MTDEPSKTETYSGRSASLADAIPALRRKNGKSTRFLQNQRTGELFYSVCSAHQDHDNTCNLCHKGVWGWPLDPVDTVDVP